MNGRSFDTFVVPIVVLGSALGSACVSHTDTNADALDGTGGEALPEMSRDGAASGGTGNLVGSSTGGAAWTPPIASVEAPPTPQVTYTDLPCPSEQWACNCTYPSDGNVSCRCDETRPTSLAACAPNEDLVCWYDEVLDVSFDCRCEPHCTSNCSLCDEEDPEPGLVHCDVCRRIG